MTTQIHKSPITLESNFIENNNPFQEENYSEMKKYIQDLESSYQNIQIENEDLKKKITNLEKEKLILSNNLEQKDISLSELTQILENLKRKETENDSKLIELEKKNEELNYKILELNQKNKSLISIKETLTQNPNLLNQKNTSQILELNEKLDESEISKQKIEFDKIMLQNKINNIKEEYENEIQLLTKLKNGEISQLQKTISSLKNELNLNIKKNTENKNDLNKEKYSKIVIEQVSSFENKISLLNEEIFNLKRENKLLSNQNMESKITNEHKDRFIEELQKRINEIENLTIEKINEIQLNSENKNTEIKELENKNEQLLIEREELLRQNRELRNGFELFNVSIKEANDLYNQKFQTFTNISNSYNLKLKEYKNKIVQLKKKVNELINENNKFQKQIVMLKDNKQKLIEGKLINKKNLPIRSPSSSPIYKKNSSFANYSKHFNINYSPMNSNNNNNNLLSNNNNLFSNNNNLVSNNNYNLEGMNINLLGNQYNNIINDDIYLKNQNLNLNSKNDNFYMKNIKDLPSDSVANVNVINRIDDPYFALQQKSLSDFRNVLSRIDLELIKNKEIRNEDDE